jgi:hypothetical protein
MEGRGGERIFLIKCVGSISRRRGEGREAKFLINSIFASP